MAPLGVDRLMKSGTRRPHMGAESREHTHDGDDLVAFVVP